MRSLYVQINRWIHKETILKVHLPIEPENFPAGQVSQGGISPSKVYVVKDVPFDEKEIVWDRVPVKYTCK